MIEHAKQFFGSANPEELGDEVARYKGKYNAKSWID